LDRGASGVPLTIKGSGFFKDTTRVIISGNGVTVKNLEFKNGKEFIANVNIDKDAEVGDRELRVHTAGGVSDGVKFKILPKQSVAATR
jgi:hypothetical protein